jgi:hypothetical protein
MSRRKYRPLNENEQRYICKLIHSLISVARDQQHPFREMALRQISLSFWRWTADAFDIEANIGADNLRTRYAP